MFGGVIGKDAAARAAADRAALTIADVVERALRVCRRLADDDFGARLEDGLEPFPVIADYRHATRRCLEQAHARRVAGANHVGSGQVQREALSGVERAVLAGGHMVESFDVGGPAVRWIPGTGEREPALGRQTPRVYQQPLERRLTIRAERAHVPEVPARLPLFRKVRRRIERAVQRACRARTKAPLQPAQSRTAGE